MIDDKVLEVLHTLHNEAKHSMATQAGMAGTFGSRGDILAFKWPDVCDAYLQFVETGDVKHLNTVRDDLNEIAYLPMLWIAEAVVDHCNNLKWYADPVEGLGYVRSLKGLRGKRAAIDLVNALFLKIEQHNGTKFRRVKPYVNMVTNTEANDEHSSIHNRVHQDG